MRVITKFLYYLLIILPIMNNFILGDYIGKIGYNPTPIIIIISYIFIFFSKVKLYKENKKIKILLIYLGIVNILSLCIYFLFNTQKIILDENLIFKSMKGYLYFVFIYLYIKVVNTFIFDLSIREVFKPFTITSLILFVILIFEVNFPVEFSNLFHNGIPYNRVRLLTSESSFTISMIFIYPIISIYYYRYINKRMKYLALHIIIFLSFIFTSGSKSVLINIPIVLIILIFIKYYNDVIKQKAKGINLIAILTVGVLTLALLPILIPRARLLISYIENDLTNYTSLITRFYTLFISMILIFKFPFGTGNAMYLKILPQELMNNLWRIGGKNYNLDEVYQMINATDDKFLGIKSGVGQYALYWGIVGTVILFIYIFDIQKKIIEKIRDGKYIILFIYIFIIVGIIDFITFEVNYDIFAMILVIQYLIRYYDKKSD